MRKDLNKILLEAVHRGIKFALDDFDDQDNLIGQLTLTVKDQNITKDYLLWQELIGILFNFNKNNKEYFDKLAELSKKLNIKYKVNDISKLEGIIKWSCQIYPNYDANLNWIDVSDIRSMVSLFHGSLFNGDISEWDVSNVEDMSYMFFKSDFNGDISKWNVSNVKFMNNMFAYSKFNQDISNWVVSNVETMIGMFEEVRPYDYQLDNWDVSNVKNMSGMFSNSWFNQPLNNWDVSNVINMADMFAGSQYDLPLDKWDVSHVKNMDSMFSASHFRQNISNWNISKDCNTNNMWRLGILYDSNKPPKTRIYRYSYRRK